LTETAKKLIKSLVYQKFGIFFISTAFKVKANFLIVTDLGGNKNFKELREF